MAWMHNLNLPQQLHPPNVFSARMSTTLAASRFGGVKLFVHYFKRYRHACSCCLNWQMEAETGAKVGGVIITKYDSSAPFPVSTPSSHR